MVKRRFLAVAFTALVLLLSACGRAPEADVKIFTMTQPPINMEKIDLMESELQKTLGETPTVALNTTPIFSLEKLVVEVAAGGNGILILNEDQIKGLIPDKESVHALDDTFDQALFPGGVIQLQDFDDKGNAVPTDKGFFVMPVEDTPWFQLGGYQGPPAYAFIPANAPNPELAKQVLKAIVEYK